MPMAGMTRRAPNHQDGAEPSLGVAFWCANTRGMQRGQLIGANDLLIAAHAQSVAATVVANNVKDFGRVKGLSAENWLQ